MAFGSYSSPPETLQSICWFGSESKRAAPMSRVVLGDRGHPELFSDVTRRIPTAFLVDSIIRGTHDGMSQIQP